ncbi:MAG: ABC transporter substrate-binding protein [Marinibacterium sp.]|nr:ABC transporter substrate-binding protein [Marinibacterium sp.]
MRIPALSDGLIRALTLALTLACIIAAHPVQALDVEDRRRFGPDSAAQVLRILSTADTDVFAPVIRAFLIQEPDIAVDYIVASSGAVMAAMTKRPQDFDVVISSAMDLQTKLANDGFALSHRSATTETIPDWARWRDHLFAFTREPATLVLSRDAFRGLPLPRSRQDLIALLRQHPDRFHGRVGTYDLRASGLGYLFATQDARMSESYWRLTEIMGSLDAQLYCCSSAMIDAVARGDLAVAYNVLGSYARARPDADRYEIIQPQDFTTVMLRTALISRGTQAPQAAGRFLDHMLDIAWLGKTTEGYEFDRLSQTGPASGAHLRYIRLGPGLLVHLDRFKKDSFLRAWESAILQD